jgi:hypothetical protein
MFIIGLRKNKDIRANSAKRLCPPGSSPPPCYKLRYSTCQLEGGGGGSQHSTFWKLCYLHKYFKFPSAICFLCIPALFN